jgi:peptide-methionine (S)-S-oxide reductase
MKAMTTISILTAALLSSCSQREVPAAASLTRAVHTSSMEKDTITFGSGCFWCTEAIFQQVEGVLRVVSGYSGGHVPNPTYEQVCDKNTGHAEVCQLVYDPAKVSVDELLEVFWQTHDPTTLDRQGNDVGPQYRSVIFYHTEEQRLKSERYREELNRSNAFGKPVVTAVEPFRNFYAAEDYHQDYYRNNRSQPYCYFVIRPKLEKFEKVFRDRRRKSEE